MREKVTERIDKAYREGSLTERQKKYLKVGIFASCECVSLAWQVYGNVLYYSSEPQPIRKCKEINNGSFLMTMFLLLLLGYCYFILYALFIGLFIFMKLRRYSHARTRRSETSRIMRSISRVKFSEELFGAISEENECIICMTPFTHDDMITKLNCAGRHYYHTACIEDWIR